ncbi:hypothetical protein HNR00_003235 [Methylorubrum rhodinum]|uniref:Uncharacterized protein n=1 Tax=Methylorubrum rhodinum TaxID=29428 RepID=A0A840ZP33_9HYPH|nr:hypothetical protein [Methylorubrum rhodinum]MBB5758513.1 hypothetical protein [Methylorubrum rhodinum]
MMRLCSAVVLPVEVCRKLELGDLVAIDEEMQPLFRDVFDVLSFPSRRIDSRLPYRASVRFSMSQRLQHYDAKLQIQRHLTGV